MLILGFVYTCAGNTELLEAIGARYEVFQGGGGSDGEVANQFYIGLLGGMFAFSFMLSGSAFADMNS